jgi:hypothetical protein
MQPLKSVGLVLAGIAGVVALVFFAALYIAGLAWVSKNVHEYLNIAATIAFAVCVIVLLPCALFRATRKFSVYGLSISSAIFGASTWILGFLVTLQYWGAIGVFVGVIMGVVGIVPLGMLASAFHSDWSAISQLAFGLALTFGARMIAVMLAAWIDRDEASINSNSPSGSQPSRRALVTACMFGLVLVGSISVWLVNTQSTTQRMKDADAAYFRKDFATAVRLVRPLADQGDAEAQFMLGSMYDEGWGAPQDTAAAANWYRKAADQGHTIAQYNLGVSYSRGGGVPQNYVEAAKWYRLAADAGFSWAQNNLGDMYRNGQGVTKDYVSAYMWFNLAAAQSEEDAAKSREEVEQLMTPAQIAEAQKLAREWKPTKQPPR